ncbi:MAG TPA: hypothetical protein VE173_11875, partial [Longimicrobiales bacterium]|nr:hypothetical protein [Longimicrobiales bacterium]
MAAAGLVSHLPGVFSLSRRVEVDGERLDALDVAPLRGRDMAWSDLEPPMAALVNEAFVRKHLAGVDPL